MGPLLEDPAHDSRAMLSHPIAQDDSAWGHRLLRAQDLGFGVRGLGPQTGTLGAFVPDCSRGLVRKVWAPEGGTGPAGGGGAEAEDGSCRTGPGRTGAGLAAAELRTARSAAELAGWISAAGVGGGLSWA